MYDQALIQPEYETTDLWKHIENIIPYYQRKFGIDGVMIDMGHALPEKLLTQIIAKARENNSDFILWEENFVPNTDSLEQGFDLLLGYLPFDQHIAYKMREFIKTMELNGFPIPCFATPETHNTPRAAIRQGGINFSKIAYIVNKLLPLPTFIHSGFELGETLPVNTGLGFDNFDVKALSADKLPLFSTASLNWNSENSIVDFICTVNKILEMFLDDDDTIKTNNAIKLIDVQQDNIVAFERKTIKENNYLLFVSNYSEFNQVCEIDIYENYNFKCLLGEATVRREDKKMIFELSKYNFELLLITIIDK
ncbi:hypothetical protein SDC9_135005 [bioreactor metagenome]|uniref:Uncharacterized protein n=1 Tax=bioreactor metagenome TaxID=1076179 RepID=A0A645DEM7_9ZZZZ